LIVAMIHLRHSFVPGMIEMLYTKILMKTIKNKYEDGFFNIDIFY